jgi:uncharacterized membrane protein
MYSMTINRIMFALAAAGLVVAGLLWYWHAIRGEVPCTNAGCDQVAQHPTSRLFGIPVAAYGTLFYLSFALLCAMRPSVAPIHQRLWGNLIRLWGFVGFGVSVYLTYLELFVIRAICQWCMVSAAIATTLFVLSLLASREPRVITSPVEA